MPLRNNATELVRRRFEQH
jgi:hypothetical protein